MRIDRCQTMRVATATNLKCRTVRASQIGVLLVDDHALVRQALRALLEAEEDIRVIGEAENGRQAVQRTLDLRPDVVVMDAAMPSLNGLEATRQVRKLCPAVKVLILSAYDDPETIRKGLDSGACGYLPKRCAAGELASAIRGAGSNKTRCHPEGHGSRRLPPRACQRHAALSPRQSEVLQLIAEGLNNPKIAAELSISVR